MLSCSILLTATGCRRGSTPARLSVSEILFANKDNPDRIVRGIYPGSEGWRWTAPDFVVRLDPPPATKEVYLELDLAIPGELNGRLPVTVVAIANGVQVASKTYREPVRDMLACKLPAQVLARRPVEVEFSVDGSFTDPPASSARSVIVVSVGLKDYYQTAEFGKAELARSHAAYEEILKQRDLKLPIEKQKEIMRLFHDLPIWESMWFHGVRIIKNPLDLWMMQQIAWEVRPDFVVETGTWYGGSALYWAHTLNGMGLENARVLTVDLQDFTNEGAASHPLWKKYVEFYRGSSTDPKIVAKIARRVKGWRVIVNLDSDHTMKHVLEELKMYAPLVNPGSYLAVEDTHLDGIPTHPELGPGPMAAVRRFLAEGDGKNFEQDFSREAMVMTSYPGGWLRRKSR